jgi:hypothetical protein
VKREEGGRGKGRIEEREEKDYERKEEEMKEI